MRHRRSARFDQSFADWERFQQVAFDQLATGVAIFAANQKLTFYNAAYRSLWDLDAGFLDQAPTDSALLDRLRTTRKLPEEGFTREWPKRLTTTEQAGRRAAELWTKIAQGWKASPQGLQDKPR